ASFRARPIGMFAYPAAAILLLAWIRGKFAANGSQTSGGGVSGGQAQAVLKNGSKVGVARVLARMFNGLAGGQVDVSIVSPNGWPAYYTIDGSQVSETSGVFSVPFQVGAGTRLRTRVLSPDGHWGPETSVRFTV